MSLDTFQPADLTPMSAVTGLPDLPAEMATIVQWANTAGAAQALVERIVDTPFMPAAFWPKFDPRDRDAAANARRQAIASGTAAVLYGGPLGLNPLQSLANIHVVKGKPGLPAELMVALVRSHGHEVGIEDLTDHRCRVWGRRSGEDTVHRAEFTIDRAKKAGYTSQNAKYGTDPQAMLYARAASILCRQMAPEVLKGLSTVEEIGDEPDADSPAPKGSRTVQRQAHVAHLARSATPALAQAPGGHTQDGPSTTPRPASAAPAEVPAPAGLPPLPGEADAITDTQLRKLGAVMGDLGVTGAGSRERRLAVASHVVGRELASSKDLTRGEARALIDTLEANGTTILRELEPQAVPDAQAHSADVDAQIDAARAAVDERAAAAEAEQAQADEVDPTVGDDPWAEAGQA